MGGGDPNPHEGALDSRGVDEAAPEVPPPDAQGLKATDEEVAAYIAKRGFVWSAWMGAAILTFSYAQLYWAFLADVYSNITAITTGIVTAILGGVMFTRSRKTWQELGGDVATRSMGSALIVAGAGGVFWMLFLLLSILVAAGVAIQ